MNNQHLDHCQWYQVPLRGNQALLLPLVLTTDKTFQVDAADNSHKCCQLSALPYGHIWSLICSRSCC